MGEAALLPRSVISRAITTAGLVEQPDDFPAAVPRLCSQAPAVAGCATWALKKSWHVAGSALRRVEQATVVTGTAEQSAAMRGSAEHADAVVIVSRIVAAMAPVRHFEQTGVLALASLTCHLDLPYLGVSISRSLRSASASSTSIGARSVIGQGYAASGAAHWIERGPRS